MNRGDGDQGRIAECMADSQFPPLPLRLGFGKIHRQDFRFTVQKKITLKKEGVK